MTKRLTPEQFITIHQKSKNLEEALTKAGISRSAYEARAHYFRTLGIPLKKFKRATLKERVPELAELAKHLALKD